MITRPIKLVADSSSDLSESEAAKLGIELVPLSVSIGKASYPENTITHDDYWRLTKGQVISTSQPPVGAFSEGVEKELPNLHPHAWIPACAGMTILWTCGIPATFYPFFASF